MFKPTTPTKVNYHTSLARDYLDYVYLKNYFKTLPRWQLVLMRAGKSDKPITLPPTDKEACLKALNSLPKANYWALSFNLDTFDDFIEEIS